jgi:hypothetical protein
VTDLDIINAAITHYRNTERGNALRVKRERCEVRRDEGGISVRLAEISGDTITFYRVTEKCGAPVFHTWRAGDNAA